MYDPRSVKHVTQGGRLVTYARHRGSGVYHPVSLAQRGKIVPLVMLPQLGPARESLTAALAPAAATATVSGPNATYGPRKMVPVSNTDKKVSDKMKKLNEAFKRGLFV